MMDHVILSNSISFASQIDNTACIFEIRYDFNLSNGTVSIPNGSILLFNGGSLSNGTIESDDCRIEGPLIRCFCNIQFDGDFLNGQLFHIEWFVDEYETSFDINSSKDATQQIQDAFDSGVRRIHFSNDRYFPITDTIEINNNIDISGTKSHLDASNNWFLREPCIYSKEVVTLLRYNFDASSGDASRSKPRLSIAGLNLCCCKEFTQEEIGSSTPVVEINNEGTNTLWGLYIDLNIIISNNGNIVTDYYRYTGIKIFAQEAPITFIELSGSVSMAYKAFDVIGQSNNTWVTDVKIWADTACVYGGDFSAVYSVHPIINYGSHQLKAYFNSYDNGEAYFKADSFSNYGYIWDAGLQDSNNKWYCQYAVMPHTPSCGFLLDRSQEQYSGASVVHPVDAFYPNLLVDRTIKYSGIGISTNTVILAYNKTNGTKENAEATTLAFRRYKFPKYLCRWDNTHYNLSHHSDIGFCYNQNDNNNYIYKETIEIVKSNFLSIQDMAPIYIGPSRPRETFSITIQYFATSTDSNPTKTINIDNSNYDTYLYGDYIRVTDLFLRKKDSFYLTAKTIITYNQDITTDTDLIPRPMFFIPNYHATGIVRSGDDTAMVNMSQYDAGEVFYHQTHGQLWWNGTKWVERDGAVAGVRRSGTFTQKPSGSDIYVGFRYFCTSGARIEQVHVQNVELFYTGSGWVDALGRTATAN